MEKTHSSRRMEKTPLPFTPAPAPLPMTSSSRSLASSRLAPVTRSCSASTASKHSITFTSSPPTHSPLCSKPASRNASPLSTPSLPHRRTSLPSTSHSSPPSLSFFASTSHSSPLTLSLPRANSNVTPSNSTPRWKSSTFSSHVRIPPW